MKKRKMKAGEAFVGMKRSGSQLRRQNIVFAGCGCVIAMVVDCFFNGCGLFLGAFSDFSVVVCGL